MKIYRIKKLIIFIYLCSIILLNSNTAFASSTISIGRIDYPDGTHEASQVYAVDNGSCEEYSQLMQEGVWKILDLKCYDKNGNFKEYLNGELKSDVSAMVDKEMVQQEGLLKKAEFDTRMAESENKGFWSAFYIAILVGFGTGLATGLISGFFSNYLFASNSGRKIAIKRIKKMFLFWKKK